jgi:hypothetical protein
MPSTNCTTGSPDESLVSPAIRREREALQSSSVLGYRARMRGLSTVQLSKATGISLARIEQLESLPEYMTVTRSESEQISKVLGSGDLHKPLSPDAIIKERHGLA